MYDLQRASMWKRFSSALFDFIMLVIAVVGAALLLSWMLGYDASIDEFDKYSEEYEAKYGVNFDMSYDDYMALDQTGQKNYDDALEAFGKDDRVSYVYGLIFNLTLVIISISILLAYMLLEFVVPMLFGNGQTLGKKIFGIAVMREDGVKLTPLLLFVRTVLGKYTLGTMVPVLIIIMMLFNLTGIVGTAVIIALILLQGGMFIFTYAHTPLHDKLAHTVTVDLASQMIFETYEDLLEHKKKAHADIVSDTTQGR